MRYLRIRREMENKILFWSYMYCSEFKNPKVKRNAQKLNPTVSRANSFNPRIMPALLVENWKVKAPKWHGEQEWKVSRPAESKKERVAPTKLLLTRY